MAVTIKYILCALISSMVTYIITLSTTDQWLTVRRRQIIAEKEVTFLSLGRKVEESQPLKCPEILLRQDQVRNESLTAAVEPIARSTARSPRLPPRKVKSRPPRWTSMQEFARRKSRVDQMCERSRIKGEVHGVYTHSSGIIYCYVPKAGCTFWKRVFTAASFPVTQDPFHLSRHFVHTNNGEGEAYQLSTAHNEAAYPIRLLVVRDPFSRLLSTYLDKFYLPDFWPNWARKVLRARKACESADFLRGHFDVIATTFEGWSGSYSTCNDNWCSKFVTFSEFVRGLLNLSEPHWAPVHEICNPCAFNVTHLSYMDTFTSDARVILSKMGTAPILDKFDQTTQVDYEIQMLVDYHFNRTHLPEFVRFYTSCLTPRELSFRLWQSFQWKGYMDPDVSYSVPDFTLSEPYVKNHLMDQIWIARRSGVAQPERMKRARQEFEIQAFRTLPLQIFEDLVKKYQMDIELFGFEQKRNDLYSASYGLDYKAKFGST